MVIFKSKSPYFLSRKLLMKCWKYTLEYTKKCKPISLIRVLLASVWLSTKNAFITLQEGEGDYRHKISKYFNRYKCSNKKVPFQTIRLLVNINVFGSCMSQSQWCQQLLPFSGYRLLQFDCQQKILQLLQFFFYKYKCKYKYKYKNFSGYGLLQFGCQQKITSSWTQFLQEESKGDLSSQCKNSNDSEG